MTHIKSHGSTRAFAQSVHVKMVLMAAVDAATGGEMGASFSMSGVVSLDDTLVEFFELLGLSAPPTVTTMQLQSLLTSAECAYAGMAADPDTDPQVEWLTREILKEIGRQLPVTRALSPAAHIVLAIDEYSRTH